MILHFTTSVKGGAGAVAYNIHSALLRQGADSILVNTEISQGALIAAPKKSLFALKKIYWLRKILITFRLLSSDYSLFGIEKSEFAIGELEKALPEHPAIDTIAVYWVSNFLSSSQIENVIIKYKPKKVVFFCLDEAHMTSSCHYSFSCKGFNYGCMTCPATNSKRLRLLVRVNYQAKKRMYDTVKPHFIFPSTSFKTKFDSSPLLVNTTHEVAPLPAVFLDELLLQKKPKEDFNVLRILIRSSSEPRKGLEDFIGLLIKLSHTDKTLLDRIRVTIVGDNYLINSELDKYVDCQFLGFINRQALIKAYVSTDALLVTSFEDSGPIMINEAISFGNYVITTPVGVSADLVNESNGFIFSNFIDKIDAVELRAAILGGIKFKRSNKFKLLNKDLTFEGFSHSILLK